MEILGDPEALTVGPLDSGSRGPDVKAHRLPSCQETLKNSLSVYLEECICIKLKRKSVNLWGNPQGTCFPSKENKLWYLVGLLDQVQT